MVGHDMTAALGAVLPMAGIGLNVSGEEIRPLYDLYRGSFPTEEAATKLIYLAIRNFEKGGRNVREWFAARNQFAIMFEERFNA
jgi:hypothetical protein